jgi:26S proteasome regulatory subunit T6
VVVAEKTQNLRRLEAQRNELNAKGSLSLNACCHVHRRYPSSNRYLSQWLNQWFVAFVVRALREELVLLQEPASYVGEVAKVMGKKKVLVKVRQHCLLWSTS